MSQIHKADVDLAGLMKVLGDHLYSTPLVAVRELIQNAHDAIVRRRAEAGDGFSPAIEVAVDPAHHSLVITDNGAGLTDEEIRRYLATVGTGYTRQLREQMGAASDELIGMFGLGFLSAFVVADKTTVWTCSYQRPSQVWQYQSRSGETYTIAEVPHWNPAHLAEPEHPGRIGTRVELSLKPKFHALAEAAVLRKVLRKYCALLPLPVHLRGDADAINVAVPPWRLDAAEHSELAMKKARLAFAEPFEEQFEPIATLPLAHNDAGLEGLLWLQDGTTYGNADNRNLHVFVRGMMLDDDARELLPRWAGFVGGVVESARLTPTASREDLQRDAAWDAAAEAIRLSLVTGLQALSAKEPEAWRRVCTFHNEALLGAALADDELFALLADAVTVPTTEGDLPARAVFARGGGKAYVSLAARGGFEETLFRAQKVPVVAGRRYGAARFCERYAEARGGTVVRLGTKEGNAAVFRRVESAPGELAFLREALAQPGQEVVAARFEPVSIPLVVVPDRDAELKAALESDDADKRIAAGVLALARKFTASIQGQTTSTLYVNVGSPSIQQLVAARGELPAATVRNHPAVALLRAVATLTSGSGEGGEGAGSFVDAYAAVARALEELLPASSGN